MPSLIAQPDCLERKTLNHSPESARHGGDMNCELHGSVAVVVGGASGIGLAIGRAFAAEGADVVLADRSPDVATRAAELTAATGVRSRGLVVDATDYAAQQQAAATIVAEFGRADHLVYAAGAG
ncbi:MAG TPA: SDR family NAD(P)-dependent oxidoreductase, partial [Pirellulaceae bacterium]|nr:SDR family NAD(P)-dependent oxidoreductase [Pirellulaceae bacterium]